VSPWTLQTTLIDSQDLIKMAKSLNFP